MRNYYNNMSIKQFKIRNWARLANVRGFTLTEVMIGMMILTVAIVSASNLLTGIISSNQNNLTTLQAYYLSQEGLEIVRNIRDTNWLHNRDWLGKGYTDIWDGQFEIDNEYVLEVVEKVSGGTMAVSDSSFGPENPVTIGNVGGESPWKITKVFPGSATDSGKIYRHGAGDVSLDKPYLDSLSDGADTSFTGFTRKIFIKEYDCLYLKNVGLCEDENAYVLVQSKVEWNLGAKQRHLILSEVLSNWKGGAL